MEPLSAESCQNLYSELVAYEKQGIDISMEGMSASPMQIVKAHLVKEDVTYMRDYMLDENGDIKEVSFHTVK